MAVTYQIIEIRLDAAERGQSFARVVIRHARKSYQSDRERPIPLRLRERRQLLVGHGDEWRDAVHYRRRLALSLSSRSQKIRHQAGRRTSCAQSDDQHWLGAVTGTFVEG
jgi:hypothetical protein